MARIDLIPRSWRDQQRVRRALKVFVWALIAALVLLSGVRGFLAWKMESLRAAALRMNEEKTAIDKALAVNRDDHDRLKGLRERMERMKANQSVSVVASVLNPLDEDLGEGITLDSMIIQFPDSARGAVPGSGTIHFSLRGESRSADHLTALTERIQARKTWRQIRIGNLVPRQSGIGQEFSLDADVDLIRVPP